jgi:hypothetical protein
MLLGMFPAWVVQVSKTAANGQKRLFSHSAPTSSCGEYRATILPYEVMRLTVGNRARAIK